MTRSEQAEKNFREGYNCAQAVALAFSDLIDMDKEALLRTASGFGGGMGRLRETCGALTGAFLVLGYLKGYPTPETGDVKMNFYARVQSVGRAFEEKAGSMVCRELMGLTEKHQTPKPDARTAEYYDKRPCPHLVVLAAEALAEELKKDGIE